MLTRFAVGHNNPDGVQLPSSIADLRGLGTALMRCNEISELRAFSPLPEDAQRQIDTAVTEVGLDRLTLVRDLMSKGLTYPLSDPLSVMELQWDAINEVGGAIRAMQPGSRGENSLLDRSTQRIPIYVTLDEFRIGIRTLRASQRVGAALDTAMVRQKVRRVNEAIEDAAWNGATTDGGTLFKVNGNSAPGILNHPDVNTFVYASGESWTAAGKTGEEILTDVLNMIEDLVDLKYYGPYTLYVTTAYWMKLMQDFKANSGLTILQRLKEIQTGSGPLDIRVADSLPADKTVLIQMTDGIMDVVVGQEPTVISWESPTGFDLMFLVMAFIIPRIKSDYNGVTGILVGYTS